ncbi:hypothetical protein HOG17_03230 [Candidatus Peregrinibacteria bacterium]|jgi:hypothetical protein|nr:hypothetical protein [Candidatus Peregrinibacteria bacterium]MBT4148220.1 hypothetical protein [Candidatus Peregrinibacteria bacterium]MBT4455984.1 hypothetical protein [Candidatus Peregrinibacteria bacterium]MBT6052932.1 hypothetical protein [Candidatus Scalindua sp.]
MSHHIALGGDKYILYMSKHLLGIIQRRKMTPFALLECSKSIENELYTGPIIILSQILNEFGETSQEVRNEAAHEILNKIPSEDEYNAVAEQLTAIAKEKYENELVRAGDEEEYKKEILEKYHEIFG